MKIRVLLHYAVKSLFTYSEKLIWSLFKNGQGNSISKNQKRANFYLLFFAIYFYFLLFLLCVGVTRVELPDIMYPIHARTAAKPINTATISGMLLLLLLYYILSTVFYQFFIFYIFSHSISSFIGVNLQGCIVLI